MERRPLSVKDINNYIKLWMEKDYVLKNVWVSGEVSNYKAHSSGHLYFTLKDQESAISCVMFRSYVSSMTSPIRNGMKVLIKGSVSVYERSGQYQIYVREMEDDGLGKLYLAFEALKVKLTGEGLFDVAHKKPIPKYPSHVGIITAATGAAIKDICNVAARRNPYVRLSLYSSLVQGPGAAENLVEALTYMNNMTDPVDVIIFGRGGGSIEDLWPFNEEIVARAIYESNIPVISGVGHETDFTIADFVADLRAPTPSAAAELAIFEYEAYMNQIALYEAQLSSRLSLILERRSNRLQQLSDALAMKNPMIKYEKYYQYIADMYDRIQYHMQRIVEKKRHDVALLGERLEGYAPTRKFSQGYGYISDQQYQRVKSIRDVEVGQKLVVTLADGEMLTDIVEIKEGDINRGRS